ncbi:uncharacterized protein VTP21DRAFT_622 [Calcarisporiella thermophila]|uniref:uncharacterized protein n=1 Tax=Calcarisporiella thermophila TaxID=911321 RepID=UPI0037448523
MAVVSRLLLQRSLLFNDNVSDDTPFCDWRVTIENCFGGQFVAAVYLAHFIFSALFVLLCGYILFDRTIRRRQRLFEWSQRELAFYPKPTEMFVLFAMLFFILRAVFAALIFNNVPMSMLARENWGNAAWPFAAAAIVFYLSGLIFATPHSYSDIGLTNSGRTLLPSPFQLTSIMFTLVLLPMALNQGLATAAGVVYDGGNLKGYGQLVTGLYLMWGIFIVVMFSFYIFFGRQLILILARNIEVFEVNARHDSSVESLSHGLKTNVFAKRLCEIKRSYNKIRGVVVLIVVLLPVVLITTLSMTFFRLYIMQNHTLSFVFAFMWINACAATVAISVVIMGLRSNK